jgi:phosphoglycolate phosphatase
MAHAPFIIWDLDGTLVDSGADIANAANAARADLDREPLPAHVVRSYVGEGAARLMQRVMGEHESAEVHRAGLDRFLIRYAEKLRVHTNPYPGIEGLVQRLTGNQAIATNKPGHLTRALLGLLGWSNHFRTVVAGGEVPNRKPAPDAIHRVLELANVRMEDALFIGDTPIDINTAKAAGIRFVCVSWGLRPREELAGAELIVDTAEELEREIFG